MKQYIVKIEMKIKDGKNKFRTEIQEWIIAPGDGVWSKDDSFASAVTEASMFAKVLFDDEDYADVIEYEIVSISRIYLRRCGVFSNPVETVDSQ